MKNVAILAYDDLALFELSCAVELFALPRPEFNNWYQTDVVSFSDQLLKATGGVQLQVKTVRHLDNYDMLVIPSWPTDSFKVPAPLINEMTRLFARGGRILSYCSGAFLLAETGLLENRQATTHWRYAEKFKSRYHSVSYIDNVLYVYDGQIGCSAGSAAAIDLSIAVIRDDFGFKIANQVARRLVLPAHRSGGQAQFVETPVFEKPDQFAATLDWALANLSKRIDIKLLAQKANMSRRTFDRKFRAALNLPAKEWLTQQRLNLAKQLLETSNDSIETVATLSGFENAMTFRFHFRKNLQLTPSQFRVQFGRKVA